MPEPQVGQRVIFRACSEDSPAAMWEATVLEVGEDGVVDLEVHHPDGEVRAFGVRPVKPGMLTSERYFTWQRPDEHYEEAYG